LFHQIITKYLKQLRYVNRANALMELKKINKYIIPLWESGGQ